MHCLRLVRIVVYKFRYFNAINSPLQRDIHVLCSFMYMIHRALSLVCLECEYLKLRLCKIRENNLSKYTAISYKPQKRLSAFIWILLWHIPPTSTLVQTKHNLNYPAAPQKCQITAQETPKRTQHLLNTQHYCPYDVMTAILRFGVVSDGHLVTREMILMLQRGRFCKKKRLSRENSENNATMTLLPVLTFSILFSPSGCAWVVTPFIQVKIEASTLSLKHQHKWLRGCGDAQHPMQWP